MYETEEAMALLGKFYPPEGMFLKEMLGFSTSSSSITGTFNVPTEAAYSVVPLNYVTAEQYVRCFSQLSYALMYLLTTYHDGMTTYGTPNEFEQLMLGGKMWYRRMNTRYLRQTLKGHDFSLELKMETMVRIGDYGVAKLRASGPIVVEAHFVVPIS